MSKAVTAFALSTCLLAAWSAVAQPAGHAKPDTVVVAAWAEFHTQGDNKEQSSIAIVEIYDGGNRRVGHRRIENTEFGNPSDIGVVMLIEAGTHSCDLVENNKGHAMVQIDTRGKHDTWRFDVSFNVACSDGTIKTWQFHKALNEANDKNDFTFSPSSRARGG